MPESPSTDKTGRADVLVLAPQPFFQERGTPIAVRLLVEELADAGYRVDLLTFHEGAPFAHPGVRLERTPRLPGLSGIKPGFSLKKLCCDALMLAGSIRLLRKNKYRLIHAVEESVFIALLLQAMFDVPFIYDMDSLLSLQLGDMFPFLRGCLRPLAWFERRAMRKSRGVLAVCEALKETVRRSAPEVPVTVLEDVNMADAPGESAPKSAGCRIMYVGNLERYQGIDLLLEAFALLPEAERAGLELVIIGGREADIEKYAAKAAGLGIEARFPGPKPLAQLGECLARADILVSTRIQGNNTPMKIYSYLASGRPVIATRLPTHTQALDDSVALLCEPTPEAMARAIRALAGDADLRERLGRAGKERAETRHSRAAFRDKLLRFYREIVGPPA